jgi:uncharacterized protein (TIGR02284 family)
VSSASIVLVHDLVDLAVDSRTFYARAADIVPIAAWQQQFQRMTAAKDEFIETLSRLVASRRNASSPRAFTRTLQHAYAEALEAMRTLGNASHAYTAPIEECESRLLRHFDQAMVEAGSAPVRAALLEQLPKLRSCHQQMRRLKEARVGSDALYERADAGRPSE